MGLDMAAKMMPPPEDYHRSWRDIIARVSRKLKNAVWGDGVQVYVAVEDSTIMRFPIPPNDANACALYWHPPAQHSVRTNDVTTKGDVSEVEVWQLIAPSRTSANASSSLDELGYDTMSYSNVPVRGELLDVLDIAAKPNSTTVEFACPSEVGSLIVELRCQRVACHVSFRQMNTQPRFDIELVRRKV